MNCKTTNFFHGRAGMLALIRNGFLTFPWCAVSLCWILIGCTSANSSSKNAKKISTGQAAAIARMDEADRIICSGDMVKITLRQPGQARSSLEPVKKDGEVATPDGSFVKAAGLSLHSFRTNLAALYEGIPSYENFQVDAFIYSSPYRVVKYPIPSSQKASTNSTVAFLGTNAPPATIFPRIFKSSLTLWDAIQLEGGVPEGVNPSKINILKNNLDRKMFDCSGKKGGTDGTRLIESGDYIFLVPEGTPLSTIFE